MKVMSGRGNLRLVVLIEVVFIKKHFHIYHSPLTERHFAFLPEQFLIENHLRVSCEHRTHHFLVKHLKYIHPETETTDTNDCFDT